MLYEKGVNMLLYKLSGWEYEIISPEEPEEHTDSISPFGIRFRPEQEDEGWLFLGFWPAGFSWDEEEYKLKGEDARIRAERLSDGSLGFYLFPDAAGDYALVSQDAEGWTDRYQKDISDSLDWMVLADGILSEHEAIALAQEAAGVDLEITEIYTHYFWQMPDWFVRMEGESSVEVTIDSNGKVFSVYINGTRTYPKNTKIIDELFPTESLDAQIKEKHSVVAQPKVVYYETLEALEAASDYILRVARLEDAEPQFTRNGSAVTAVQTLSQVEILEVFKDPHGSLNPGDPLTVLEYAVWDEEQATMYHVGDYILMEEGAGYLLFLMETGNPWLAPVGIYEGVISLDGDGRDTPVETIEGITIPSWNAYTEVWQSARSKYAP